MIPEADREKTEQERLDPHPVPEILMRQVKAEHDDNEERPLCSDARSAPFLYLGLIDVRSSSCSEELDGFHDISGEHTRPRVWCWRLAEQVSGGTPEIARGTRALPRTIGKSSFDILL